jgi:hypothetical protein
LPHAPLSPPTREARSLERLEFETKYVVPLSAAPSLLSWVQTVSVPDRSVPPGSVHTVYFDTPRLSLLGEKIDSDYLKTKVRIRWYSDLNGDAGPAIFAEAKFRVGSRREKVRARLHVATDEAIARRLDDPVWAEWLDPLRRLAPQMPARLDPILKLRYVRHRLLDTAGHARLTVDEAVTVDALNPSRLHGTIPATMPWAVCEYKGISRELPARLAPITRFGARRGSLSKYLACYQLVTRTAL